MSDDSDKPFRKPRMTLLRRDHLPMGNVVYPWGAGLQGDDSEKPLSGHIRSARRRPRLFFAWYDFWIGFYYDRKGRCLYVCLIPTICLAVPLG